MTYSSKYQGKIRDSGLKYSEFVNKMFIECDDKVAELEIKLIVLMGLDVEHVEADAIDKAIDDCQIESEDGEFYYCLSDELSNYSKKLRGEL